MEPLPEHLDRRVRSALGPGENLIWAGQPSAGRFMWNGMFRLVCGLPLSAVGLALVWAALDPAIHSDLGAWGRVLCLAAALPVLLVGFWLVGSPYWMYRKARQTCYALTDQRGIAWEAGWFGRMTVHYFPVHKLSKITRRDFRGGAGDLIFDRQVFREWRYGTEEWGGMGLRTRIVEYGFFAVKNVAEVEKLVRGMLLARKQP